MTNCFLLRKAVPAIFTLLACLFSGCARATPSMHPEPTPIPTTTDFNAYIARPEPAYKWAKTGGSGNLTELKLTSQEWQGQVWTHKVQVFRPETVRFPDTALVLISYGGGSDMETLFGQIVANTTGMTFVNLFDVPNEPLFGRNEDELVAYSFDRYIESGDSTWPLLLPMTKSVVKAMDAVGELSKQEWKQPITKFGISGVSKRGWTAWLAGAVDRRVIGIAPIVYNNLNLPAQMPHQLETWGKYSEMIDDYTRLGLQQKMTTPRGRMLSAMVDPYSYRDRIAMPKLIVNATNDRYWTLDAMSLYGGGLIGQTNVMEVPNTGHMLTGQERKVFGSITAWFVRVAAGSAMPEVKLKPLAVEANGAHSFRLTAGTEVSSAQLWVATSQTQDFRDSHWDALTMTGDNGGYVASVVPPDGHANFVAVFGDALLPGGAMPLHLSSSVIIWKNQ